jgi:hypothetical protein
VTDRDHSRSARHREVRGRTENVSQQKRVLKLVTDDDYPADVERPRTRGDCENAERPCPFVSCRWHLYLEVSDSNDNIKLNFPDIEPDELEETCALDVADRGVATLERVGELMNVTRERIRQLEVKASKRMASRARLAGITPDLVEDHAPGAWDDLRSESGGAGPVAETTESLFANRGTDLDEDAAFCDRVYRAYERALRQGAPEPLEHVEHVEPLLDERLNPEPLEPDADPDEPPAPPDPTEIGQRLEAELGRQLAAAHAHAPEPVVVQPELAPTIFEPAKETPTMTNEEKILEALHEWWETHKVAPTVAQLLDLAELKNANLVSATLSKMRAKGVLDGMLPTKKNGRREAGAPTNGHAAPNLMGEAMAAQTAAAEAFVAAGAGADDVERLLEKRVAYHEAEEAKRAHHAKEAIRFRAALDALRSVT